MEWTCSSTSSLTIVNGISATAGQEGLGGPAVGEGESLEKQVGKPELYSSEPQQVTGQDEYNTLLAQQGLGPTVRAELGFPSTSASTCAQSVSLQRLAPGIKILGGWGTWLVMQ